VSWEAAFREETAQRRVEEVPLSHLSVELGHLYMEDFAAGPDRLAAEFARVRPWARAATDAHLTAEGRGPRISTCFLVDDYFTRFSSPAEVIPMLLDAARAHDLTIDYLVKESSCAESSGSPLAELVAARLTALPLPGANGARPPVLESGWLSNGQRSPGGSLREAMRREDWRPPVEIGARNHSVFVDVELWREHEGSRQWSCAYLATVWQLLRLGLLRDDGASVVRPAEIEDLPTAWDELPSIVQLNPTAAPFCAYRTFSVLPTRFLQVEQAVRVVLNQVALPADVLDQAERRSAREGIEVPRDVTKRINYVFFGDY